MTIVSNAEDVLDSRDIIRRIEELEEIKADPDGGFDDDEETELQDLLALAEEASSSPDWEYGETLIRDSYFRDYAKQLADDIGAIDRDAAWPVTYIDWDRATDALRQNYQSVDFGDVLYWIHC